MSVKGGSLHINLDELVKLKIPALSGLEAKVKNNRLILRHIAMNGPLLKYGIFKNLEPKGLDRYSTVSRRVDDLNKRGYLAEAGMRPTERGKQTEEHMYGLTWKGFIASLSIEEVRENIFRVLERNPLLTFPEKETVLLVLKEIITQQELEVVAKSMLEAYMKAIPNLEIIREEHLLIWLATIREVPPLPENFRLRKIPEDGWELLDKPTIFQLIKEKLVPFIRKKTNEIKAMYMILRAFNELGDFIYNLEAEDKPSKRIKKYIETDFTKLLSDTEKDFLKQEQPSNN